MDQIELFILLEKAKTVPLESAEIQELQETPEIQEIMNLIGLTTKPLDVEKAVKRIMEDLKNVYQ